METPFTELGLDSLDIVECVVAIEDEFGTYLCCSMLRDRLISLQAFSSTKTRPRL